MDSIRNALNTLRLQIEKGSARRKEADAQTMILESRLEHKDAEIVSLQDRLSLTRRLIALADEWDQARRKLQEVGERIKLADTRVERLSNRLERVESESDAFEVQYTDLRTKQRELDAELAEFLA